MPVLLGQCNRKLHLGIIKKTKKWPALLWVHVAPVINQISHRWDFKIVMMSVSNKWHINRLSKCNSRGAFYFDVEYFLSFRLIAACVDGWLFYSGSGIVHMMGFTGSSFQCSTCVIFRGPRSHLKKVLVTMNIVCYARWMVCLMIDGCLEWVQACETLAGCCSRFFAYCMAKCLWPRIIGKVWENEYLCNTKAKKSTLVSGNIIFAKWYYQKLKLLFLA